MELGSVERVMSKLKCFAQIALHQHWFCLPEMGHLVASTYNVAFVVLSPQLNLTYLPLFTGVEGAPKVICIELVNDNHFVQVTLNIIIIFHFLRLIYTILQK